MCSCSSGFILGGGLAFGGSLGLTCWLCMPEDSLFDVRSKRIIKTFNV